MTIHGLDFISIACLPTEADTPLIVDTNTLAATTIIFEHFQSIAGRHHQVLQVAGTMQIQRLAPHGTLDRPESRNRSVIKQTLSRASGEDLDHTGKVLRNA